jgi:hypothetical protein
MTWNASVIQKPGIWRNSFTALRRLPDWSISYRLFRLHSFRMDLTANTSRAMRSTSHAVLLYHCLVRYGTGIAQCYDWATGCMAGVRFPRGPVIFFFIASRGAVLGPTQSTVRWSDKQDPRSPLSGGQTTRTHAVHCPVVTVGKTQVTTLPTQLG